jgi:hypothetical protein
LPRGTSLIHLSSEAHQSVAEASTFQRRITISSLAHPSHRKDSMPARCLSLLPMVPFRFLQFRNGHRDLLCAVIVFEMFRNESGPIPPSAMWSVQLLTAHHLIHIQSGKCRVFHEVRFADIRAHTLNSDLGIFVRTTILSASREFAEE